MGQRTAILEYHGDELVTWCKRLVEEPNGNNDPNRGTCIIGSWYPTPGCHTWVPPSFVQYGVLVGYTLSFSLSTYTLGSMQSSGLKSSMYPIWAISLFMLHACTDTITAYTLDDNRQVTRLKYQVVMYFAYTVLLVITVGTVYSLPLVYLALIAYVRYAQRLAVCFLAANSWNLNKMVADYMYDDKKHSKTIVFDPATLQEGCSYLVDWPLNKSKNDATQLTEEDPDEVIDIGKIWRCKDKSLSQELKDACLSFSLFHLLRRRFFGFACDESKVRARNFILKGLLSEDATDYKWVFKVIEVELAFMYDFFFTKYAVIYYGSTSATISSLFSAYGILVIAYITVRSPVKISRGDSAVITTTTDDIVITLVILGSTALLEFVQLLLYWTGIWGRVSFVCPYIREQARLNSVSSQSQRSRTRGSSNRVTGLMGFLANIGVRFTTNHHYWQHKLGQYSLLDSISFNPITPETTSADRSLKWKRYSIEDLQRLIYLFDHLLVHPKNVPALRVRKETGKPVELPDEVKEAVLGFLKHTWGTLSNGKKSLESKAQHLSWACTWEMHPDTSWSQRKQNQTHIILTWHIATCYCEMLTLSPEFKIPFSIATKLSKYCAYLVVCAPKLLPGHHYDTRRKFDEAAVEAVAFLEKATSKYEAMRNLTVPEATQKIFERGVKLGQELEQMEEGVRWKVMADFWAEMILYLAPSDNVEEHIEQLAKGGEFITHLWALLSHAGILEREQEHQPGPGGV